MAKRIIIGLMVLIIAALGARYLGTFMPAKPASEFGWSEVSGMIRQSVIAEMMSKDAVREIFTDKQIEELVDCTTPEIVDFLEHSGCNPKSPLLEQCLVNKGMNELIEQSHRRCAEQVLKPPTD